MCQRAQRDQVNAGRGDGGQARGVRPDAARGLDDGGGRVRRESIPRWRAAVGRHVIQQDHVGAALHRVAHLLLVLALHLDAQQMRGMRARPQDRRAHASRRRDMVILDQHAIIQPGAMVAPAAHAHRVLLQRAQPRRRLARIHDLRPCIPHRRDTARRQRGDAGEPPQEVERGPLGRQQRARLARDLRQRRASLHRVAIRHERLERALGSSCGEDARAIGSPATTPASRATIRAVALHPRRDRRLGRHVAAPDVLGQRAADQVAIEERIEGWYCSGMGHRRFRRHCRRRSLVGARNQQRVTPSRAASRSG